MARKVTPAIRWLRDHEIVFETHDYAYVARGGTRASSEALGVDEHAVIKTLVLVDEARTPRIVLMHGDRQISTKALARQLGVKKITPCDAPAAQRITGYKLGGTSPFGTRQPVAVYVESSVLALDRIWINGGGRGLLVSLDPAALTDALGAEPVEVAI